MKVEKTTRVGGIPINKNATQIIHSRCSFKGGYIGDYFGDYYRGY